MKTVEVEILKHLNSTAEDPLWLAIVTNTRSRRYFIVYAVDKPSEEEVRSAWKEDRKAFRPYPKPSMTPDEIEAVFLGSDEPIFEKIRDAPSKIIAENLAMEYLCKNDFIHFETPVVFDIVAKIRTS